MNPKEILSSKSIETKIALIANNIHQNGPTNTHDLEILSYCKLFHSEIFLKYEDRLLYLLGLFYKVKDPGSMIELVYDSFANEIRKIYGDTFTPIQAAISLGIETNRVYSFSAPTSTGKSHLLRSMLDKSSRDVVIVVPSRALIAEYISEIRKKFSDNNKVLILHSIDDVNKAKTERRIFVVTPERALELLSSNTIYNIDFVFYDEAQISEDERRGYTFDYLVRSINSKYPDVSKVFSHPFVNNPEAQLYKHNITSGAAAVAFQQQMVGKIFLHWDKEKKKFYYFSPYVNRCHILKHKLATDTDIPMNIIDNSGTILVYTSKKSLYSGKWVESFSKYINRLEIITNKTALKIIEQIEDLIGAKHRDSKLVSMMKRGVVIHHGSMPLNVRYLVEKFTNLGYAKFCFATSTLAQGVNMPFDLVWLDNVKFNGDDDDKRLALRNLIGRAGRTNRYKMEFDIGYVVVSNPELLSDRLNSDVSLSPVSKIDDTINVSDDWLEHIEAIKNEDLDQRYQMATSKIERLRSAEVSDSVLLLIELLYSGDEIITGSRYNILPDSIRNQIKQAFQDIYTAAIGRDLNDGEMKILSTAIAIMLWKIQGKSFKEIISLRHYFLTRQHDKNDLKNKLDGGMISIDDYREAINKLSVRFSAQAYELPNSTLSAGIPPRFDMTPGNTEIDYDLLVYDTYDYLDKVISFSMSNTYCAAFEEYYEMTSDYKALDMANYFRYGSRDSQEIMLLRYGFSFEEIEIIRNYVDKVDENSISFKDSISDLAGSYVMELVSRYI